jgi:PST family polysaccharide transporter
LALCYQQYALMRRALMFRKLAIIDVSGNAIGTALAVLLTHKRHGYWALACKPATAAFVTACAVWATCGWWPGHPAFTQNVSVTFRFGLNVTGFIIANIISRSMDRVALGYTYGLRVLGFYRNAFNVYGNAVGVSAASLDIVVTVT